MKSLIENRFDVKDWMLQQASHHGSGYGQISEDWTVMKAIRVSLQLLSN